MSILNFTVPRFRYVMYYNIIHYGDIFTCMYIGLCSSHWVPLTVVLQAHVQQLALLVQHSHQYQLMETLYTSSSPLMTCIRKRAHPRSTRGLVAVILSPNSTLLQPPPAPPPPQHTAGSTSTTMDQTSM